MPVDEPIDTGEPDTPAPLLLMTEEHLARQIFVLRGIKVMLDSDLAVLYGVTTKAFNQAVSRNLDRFPPDFRFELTDEEHLAMRSHFVTASRRNVRFRPAAFTEYGIGMLSGVLRSPRAVQVNIAIMRAFGQLREAVASHAYLTQRIDDLEVRYDGQFARVFDALRELMKATQPSAPQLMAPKEATD